MPTQIPAVPTEVPSPPEQEGVLRLADGRRLSYATSGAPAGPLVVVLDGPGSRGLARGAAGAAAATGIRLVAPDRPGFARSDAAPGRGIAGWAEDHAALLDALGAQRAGILAQSGGTPYALAAAAALPGRTPGLAFVGGLAPLDEPGSLAETASWLRRSVRLARRVPWLLGLGLRSASRGAAKDPAKAARRLAANLSPADVAALDRDPGLWAMHERATAEILARPEAVARELALLAGPWGVEPRTVDVPAALWVGELDLTHPPAHARRLAAGLRGAPVRVVPGAATFGMRAIYPDALRFAAGA